MMKLAPAGFRGIIFAALLAAIVSSVGSMMNSIGTIFTMDIVRHLKAVNDEQRLVRVGRTAATVGLIFAIIAAKPLLGSFDQAFQYIQEFTGFFTPGIVAIFLLGMFWKGATANGALWAAVSSAVLSLVCRTFWPALPFMDRVGLVFLASLGLGILVSVAGGQMSRSAASEKAIDLSTANFRTRPFFNFGGVVVAVVLVGLYSFFW
jgi:SSS family solute:Na+ symporter